MLNERLNEAAKRGEVHQAPKLGGLLAWRGLGVRRRRKLGALGVSSSLGRKSGNNLEMRLCGRAYPLRRRGGEDDAALRSCDGRSKRNGARLQGLESNRGWSIPAEVLECQVFPMVVHADRTGTELHSNLNVTEMSTVLLAPSDISSLPCSQQLTQSSTHQSSGTDLQRLKDA